jgi:large subunit ribosomal protein L25
MSVDYVLNAEIRTDSGKGASRRLRRTDKIPAILYGGRQEPVSLSLPQNEVHRQVKEEGFFSHILTIRIGDRSERAILRDIQRHPYKPLVQHLDFQRVSEDETIRVHVPLHLVNEDRCKGVRQEGGVISRLQIEVEVSCLPKNLPEFIEVDVANLGMNESIHLSEIVLPEGVELVQLAHEGADTAVVNVHYPHGAGRDEEEAEGEGEVEREED